MEQNSINTVSRVHEELRSFLGPEYDRLITERDLRVVQGEKELPWRNGLLKMVAYHGSPHQFERFETEHVGGGEGSQAYGHGLYFSGSKDVAEFYREGLSAGQAFKYKGKVYTRNFQDPYYNALRYIAKEGKAGAVDHFRTMVKYEEDAKQRETFQNQLDFVLSVNAQLIEPYKDPGTLYEVALAPSEDEYLLWDKPLYQQSEKVMAALLEAITKTEDEQRIIDNQSKASGAFIYKALAIDMGDRSASEYLHSLGIRGIKYLDAESRRAGEGTYNYVVFSDNDVEITARYSRHNQKVGGAYDPSTDTMYLVADGIEPGQVEPVLLHEGFHRASHRGDLQPILDELGQLDELAEAGSNDLQEWFVAAREAAQVDKGTPQYLEEIGAYAVRQYESSPNLIKRWVDKLVATVKASLFSFFGIRVGKVDPAMLREIAASGLKSSAEQAPVAAADDYALAYYRQLGITEKEAQRQYDEVVSRFKGTDLWMKAPNGEPTKLNERQWVQAQTAAFKEWFGDSNVVDENGDLMAVYHGTAADFSAFSLAHTRGQIGFHFGTSEQAEDIVVSMGDLGIYDEDGIPQGANTVPVYLAINNPVRLDDLGSWYGEKVVKMVNRIAGTTLHPSAGDNTIKAALKARGYDGVVYKNTREGNGEEDSYIAFSPNQIKSAIGNTGQFSSYSDDIRYSRDQVIAAAKAFYSKLEEVSRLKFVGMKAQGVINFLSRQGVKKSEIEAVGLNEWLAAKGSVDKVTRDELLGFVQANTVELEDIVLGEGNKNAEKEAKLERLREEAVTTRNRNAAKYQTSKVSGWPKKDQVKFSDITQEIADLRSDLSEGDVSATHFSKYTEPGAVERSYREMFVTAPDPRSLVPPEELAQKKYGKKYYDTTDEERWAIRPNDWQDGHDQYSDVENPIVRIRFNEVQADGKRILRIEEMQGPSPDNQAKMPKHLRENIYQLGVKRILAYAKENGFDGVALATKPGRTAWETQADRYSLEKQVKEINYAKNADGTFWVRVRDINDNTVWKAENAPKVDVTDTVGKEIAEKMARGEGHKDATWAKNTTLSGLDLRVGGEGLKKLYDQQLPAMLEAYGKGKMLAASLVVPGTFKGDDTAHFYAAESFKQDGQSKQEAIDGMRQAYPDSSESSIKEAVEAVYGSTISFFPLTNAPSSYPLYCKTTSETIPTVFTSDQAAEVRRWLQKYVETGHFDYYRYEVFSKRLQAAEDGVDHIEWATGLYAEMVAEEQREGLRVEENEAARAAANQKSDEENARIKAEMKAGRCENKNMQAWLDTLENPAKDAYHENGVFNLSSYSAFICDRDNEFQKIQKQSGGSKYDYAALARHLCEYVDANLSDRVKRELDQLDFAITETYANDDFWKVILDSTASAGPFDGGCLICAKAIVAAAGRGEIVRIVSDLNDGQTEHYGVRICSKIFDFGGRHESPDAWIKWLAEEEGITDRTLSFAEGVSRESCILSDCTAENAIAGMIRDVRPEAEQEDRLPEKITMGGPRG